MCTSTGSKAPGLHLPLAYPSDGGRRDKVVVVDAGKSPHVLHRERAPCGNALSKHPQSDRQSNIVTSIKKLTDLFRAIAAENLNAAKEIGTQISAHEERKGHRIAARQLRGALAADAAPSAPRTMAPDNSNILSTALVRIRSTVSLKDVVLSAAARRELDQLIREYRLGEKLKQRGINPRSKLLFHGPPGCGKSLTALALGQELQLPVYIVRFDAVIGAFLGQTAIHLRQLFYFAETSPCVLLLDELDALGKRRGNPLDVGELDRIVISLLQELEHSHPKGVVIGTTNLSKHLDDALWRRFDLELRFGAPTRTALRTFVSAAEQKRRVSLPAAVRRQALNASSFAAAEQVVISELRRQILADEAK